MNATSARIGFHGPPTSTIDWCEENYQFSHYIAEMANSVSNIFTIAVAVYGAYLSASEKLPLRFIVGYVGMALVGLGSFWFHATLLFHAQLADELPMIYVSTTALFLLFDREPGFTFKSRRTKVLGLVAVLFDVVFTWTYYLNRNPVYHQFVFGTLLLTIAFRIYYLLTRSPLRHKVPADKKKVIGQLFGSGVAQFVFAFVLWNLDNIFCETITRWKVSVGWPMAFLLEGHSWWHVFTASGTYFKTIGIQYLALCLKDDHSKFTLVHDKVGIPYMKRILKQGKTE